MQTPRLVPFTFAAGIAIWLTGCAETPPPIAVNKAAPTRGTQHVRTTAYTGSEGTGHRNALGQSLVGSAVSSAASDWSRFPLGTKFRIRGTNEVYQIDDYGGALIGTNTIDLYKRSRAEMRAWGVRNVDIDIIEWGSDQRSLHVLTPRARNRIVRRMIAGIAAKQGARQLPAF